MRKSIITLLLVCVAVPMFAQFGPRIMLENSNTGISDIITADINKDGLQDIVVAQKYQFDQLGYYLNLGNGLFDSLQVIQTQINDPLTVASADFDGDGWDDVIASSNALGFVKDTLFLFTNNSGTSFTTSLIDTLIGAGDLIAKLKTADMDNDNDMDIVAITDTSLAIYYNDGTGVFTKVFINLGVITECYELALSDIDNDGFIDAVVGGIKTIIYKNINGVLAYDSARTASVINSGLVFMTNLNDLDNDGDMDLIISGNNLSDVRWYSNDGSGFYSFEQIIQTNITQCNSLSSNDFDLDGDVDIFTGYPQTGKVVWYENMGSGNFGSEKIIYTGNVPFTTRFYSEDLNNDGSPDLIWSDELTVHLNSTVVGVDEVSQNASVRIYPNPSIGAIQIRANAESEFTIYNNLGQRVGGNLKLNAGDNVLKLSLLPGVYVFRFGIGNDFETKKVIIQ